ncbi:MAG: beta-ketoacyl-ACP synthase III [Bacteroidales bacterium]|jgi:3-oxoacyl-[acyl-carrier-protein] synthase-3|nr:beta-ketoacyl-ACP synthase III [Bacteroidales bacterium]
MLKEVYITKLSKFLPNNPVSNDEIEDYLGYINGKPSKSKNLVLRSNRIKQRYYAVDKNGKVTHTNAQLTSEAVKGLFNNGFSLDDIQLLACSTSSPDQLQPSHSSMVHGELGCKPIEIMSAGGTCNSGMVSLKYALMSIQTGNSSNAVVTGSERFSTRMNARHFQKEVDKLAEIEENPYVAFEKDFLRWMLSDGAAAALLQDKPNSNGLSLKIDWLDVRSYANELKTCMYAGAVKDDNGDLIGWAEHSPEELVDKSVFALKQDVKTLGSNIVPIGMKFLADIIEKRNIDISSEVDYFLPHLSSMFFKERIEEELKKNGVDIPEDKWFLNLPKIGNLGSGSALFMLEELFNSGKLQKGEKILVMVPESARFAYSYIMLTVV